MGRLSAVERSGGATLQLGVQVAFTGRPISIPAPGIIAFAAACAEILLPLLLVIGLATRFAALDLLLMTLVVQLTVPEGWPLQVTWAAMALAIMSWGPGRVSLDELLKRRKS